MFFYFKNLSFTSSFYHCSLKPLISQRLFADSPPPHFACFRRSLKAADLSVITWPGVSAEGAWPPHNRCLWVLTELW